MAFCFAISLVFSNNAYIYLSVSYIQVVSDVSFLLALTHSSSMLQMLKAFTPVTVLIFSFFSGLEKTSCIELYIVLIICIGVAMTSVGEMYFSWTGIS